MTDMPMSPDSYGSEDSLPEDCKDACCSMCKDKTADELSKIADYFSNQSSMLRNKLTSSITMEDYESIKGEDESIDDGD